MKTAIRLTTLLLAQVLWLNTALAADVASPISGEEFSKQDMIYKSQGEAVPEGYTLDRPLSIYTDALNGAFESALSALGPNDRWLDIGAGKGLAILDYYAPDYDLAHPEQGENRGKKARAVAMSIEDRRPPEWQKTAAGLTENQLRYLFGKRLRDYSLQELGKFQVITDVIGGFSYTSDLSLFMEKTLSFLELNGSFFTVLQDVQSEQNSKSPYYKDAPFLTEIKTLTGTDINVCTWLKRIECVEVTCESKTGWKPPIEAFRVRKICNDVKVPALVQTHFQSGTPPERTFRLTQ